MRWSTGEAYQREILECSHELWAITDVLWLSTLDAFGKPAQYSPATEPDTICFEPAVV